MQRSPKKPLTKKQKVEIWKSFWLHAIGAAVFIPFVVIASNVGVMADTHLALKSVILGIPNFLVWARFVTKIRKYQESTGIPYPSTYFALAVGSFVFIVGPLLMFLFLLIRMSRIPTAEEPKAIAECIPAPTQLDQRSAANRLSLEEHATEQNRVVSLATLKQGGDGSKPAVMKPDAEEQPSATPILDDEPFYEEAGIEVGTDAMKPGLWTKAFAEADGDNNRAKAIYIRMRVAQLMGAKEAEMKELQRLEKERIAAKEHARFIEETARLEAARDHAARQEADELEKQKAALNAHKEEVDRAEAAKLELKIKTAETDKARLEANKKAAILAEHERFQNRQDAIRRFKTVFGNIKPYPAKISIGRNFIYFFKKYDLIIGLEEILFIPQEGDLYATILVSPKLGDFIQTHGIWEFDINVKATLSDGTFLRINLNRKSLKALRDWIQKREWLRG